MNPLSRIILGCLMLFIGYMMDSTRIRVKTLENEVKAIKENANAE